MNQTEANIAFNPEVLITLGSSKVPGRPRAVRVIGGAEWIRAVAGRR